MTPRRHRNAWIWVAITAIALASVARAQSGWDLARTYANPVVMLFSAERAAQPLGSHSFAAHQSRHNDHASAQRDSGATFVLGLLPVLFVGLVSAVVLSPRSSVSLGNAFPAPAPASLFQRPPPVQLL